MLMMSSPVVLAPVFLEAVGVALLFLLAFAVVVGGSFLMPSLLVMSLLLLVSSVFDELVALPAI
jgi:hypothetical protein